MKKYITPNMKINMFLDITETAESLASDITNPTYVNGLQEVDQKTQVNLSNVREITRFIY